MSQNLDIGTVVQLTLDQLCFIVGSDSAFTTVEHFYAMVMRDYLGSQADDLAGLVLSANGLNKTPYGTLASTIAQLRLELLSKKIQPETVLTLQSLCESIDPATMGTAAHVWLGECAFVLATVASTVPDYAEEERKYLQAAEQFEAGGAYHKSLKAFQNAIAAAADRDPSKLRIQEFLALAKRAIQRECPSVAGLAFGNLSRCYQKLGAYRWALRYAHQAIDQLENERGNLSYYLAVAHRAHIYLETKNNESASADLELLLESNHDEVRQIRNSLFIKLEAKRPVQGGTGVIHFWDQRDLQNSMKELGELQQNLVAMLFEAPRSKHEIIEALYKDEYRRLDFEILENRFKNLLVQLRKRFPNLIHLENGVYSLSRMSS